MSQVTPRLEELQLFKLHEAKNAGVSVDDRDNSSRKNVREKRKSVSNLNEEQSPAKRHKDKAKNVKITSEDGKGQAKDTAKVNNTKPDIAASKPASGSKKENKEVSSGKPPQYNDQCTAFVSNLNLKVVLCWCFLKPILLNEISYLSDLQLIGVCYWDRQTMMTYVDSSAMLEEWLLYEY